MYLQSDEAQIQAKKGPAGVAIAKSNKCMSFQCLHAITENLHDMGKEANRLQWEKNGRNRKGGIEFGIYLA